MRLHLLRAAVLLALTAPASWAIQPRQALDAGAPVLTAAVERGPPEALLTLASTRHPTLRRRLEADADAPAPTRKRGRGSRAAAQDDVPAAGETVTVDKGDTLYSLAGRNHVTVEAVARLNGLKPPYALTPGRTLKLPAPKTYVARKGDTVSAVADRYGVKEALLRKANPDLSGDRLRRGSKLVLPAAAKDSGTDANAQGSAAEAASDRRGSQVATAPDAATCPRHRGRKACLAAARKAADASARKDAAREDVADAETAAQDLKACRRRHSRRTCAAQAQAAATSPAASRKAAADEATAALNLKACRRRHSRRVCAAQAVADAGEPTTSASTSGSRKAAADEATAALNLKACRRRHSRRVCAAQAATAEAAETPPTDVAATPRPRRQSPAVVPAPTPDAGVSAESMVASLPSASASPPVRSQTRLAGEASAPVTPAPAMVAPLPPPRARTATAELSPGPRPYASVFGGDSIRTPSRPARDRSGRTSQDAQAAAAAATRRDYARASIPSAPVSTGAEAASGRPRFAWPVSGDVISGFGPKGAGLRNDGLDLAASLGDPVKASAAGEVVYAGGAIPGFGNLVLVKHAGGYVTAYGHLSRISVAMRQAVRQGDVVGEVGQTGAVARPELHFEIRFAASPEENARPVDPAPLLPRRG